MGIGQTSGAIWLHRQILKSTLWQLPDAQFKVCLTCLMLANWQVSKWRSHTGVEVQIPRGSFITTIQRLAETAGVTYGQARRGLKSGRRIGFLEAVGAANRYTVVSVVKYDTYQSRVQTSGGPKDRPSADERRTSGGPCALGKEREEEEEGKKDLYVETKKPRRAVSQKEQPEQALWLARRLSDLVAKNYPDGVHAKRRGKNGAGHIAAWADSIRLLNEQGGQTWKRIHKVLDWSQQDDFWMGNIQSGRSLRKQFDPLAAAMDRPERGGKYLEPDRKIHDIDWSKL